MTPQFTGQISFSPASYSLWSRVCSGHCWLNPEYSFYLGCQFFFFFFFFFSFRQEPLKYLGLKKFQVSENGCHTPIKSRGKKSHVTSGPCSPPRLLSTFHMTSLPILFLPLVSSFIHLSFILSTVICIRHCVTGWWSLSWMWPLEWRCNVAGQPDISSCAGMWFLHSDTLESIAA